MDLAELQCMSEDDQAMHEIILDRQRMAEGIAKRIESGLATTEDAIWIRAECGIPYSKGMK
jgi:hypothetical protein